MYVRTKALYRRSVLTFTVYVLHAQNPVLAKCCALCVLDSRLMRKARREIRTDLPLVSNQWISHLTVDLYPRGLSKHAGKVGIESPEIAEHIILCTHKHYFYIPT